MSISTIFLSYKLKAYRQILEILYALIYHNTVKPVLSGHSKIDKIKILKTKGSLIKVKSIAECSKRAFCNTFDLH